MTSAPATRAGGAGARDPGPHGGGARGRGRARARAAGRRLQQRTRQRRRALCGRRCAGLCGRGPPRPVRAAGVPGARLERRARGAPPVVSELSFAQPCVLSLSCKQDSGLFALAACFWHFKAMSLERDTYDAVNLNVGTTWRPACRAWVMSSFHQASVVPLAYVMGAKVCRPCDRLRKRRRQQRPACRHRPRPLAAMWPSSSLPLRCPLTAMVMCPTARPSQRPARRPTRRPRPCGPRPRTRRCPASGARRPAATTTASAWTARTRPPRRRCRPRGGTAPRATRWRTSRRARPSRRRPAGRRTRSCTRQQRRRRRRRGCRFAAAVGRHLMVGCHALALAVLRLAL